MKGFSEVSVKEGICVRAKLPLILLVSVAMTGCADWWYGSQYEQIEKGSVKGYVIIEWVSQDDFLFVPDAEEPLTFKQSNGEVI